jgi:hypothetical protein
MGARGWCALLLWAIFAQLVEGFVPVALCPRFVTWRQCSSSDDLSNLEAFFERSSREGAHRVRGLQIEERTRLAMVAEQLEDEITEYVEKLWDVGKDGDAEKVFSLQVDIQRLKEEYKFVVGARSDSPMSAVRQKNISDQDDQEE